MSQGVRKGFLFRNIPNILCIIRICAVPVIMILLYIEHSKIILFTNLHPEITGESLRNLNLIEQLNPGLGLRHLSFWSFFIFLIASITDYLDGTLARKYNLITPLGKLLDPMADKLFITACFVMFVEMARLEAWIAVIIIGREILLTGLRSISVEEGISFQTSDWGKYKTVYQICAISALLLYYKRRVLFLPQVDCYIVGYTLIWVALILTVVSGIDYFVSFFKEMKKQNKL